MSRSTAAAVAAVFLLLFGGRALASFFSSDTVPVERRLFDLKLGDSLKRAKKQYPPTRDWPSTTEPMSSFTHVTVPRSYARSFPEELDILKMDFRWRALVRVEGIYSRDHEKKEPLESLVVRLSTIYGEPRRRGMTYVWQDHRTVMRAFNEEIPAADGSGTELRAALEIMNADEYRPSDDF